MREVHGEKLNAKIDWSLVVACFALLAIGFQTWFAREALSDYRRSAILERQIDRCADANGAIDEFLSKFMLLDPSLSRPGIVTFDVEVHRMRAAIIALMLVGPAGFKEVGLDVMERTNSALAMPSGPVTHEHISRAFIAISDAQVHLLNECSRLAGGSGGFTNDVDRFFTDIPRYPPGMSHSHAQ